MRVALPLPVAFLCAALAGCEDMIGVSDLAPPPVIERTELTITAARQLDVLFLQDDSGSTMPPVLVRQNLPLLVDRLNARPGSVHLGVITSDLGAPGISCGKNRGAQLQAVGAGAALGCDGPVGDRFLRIDTMTGSSNAPPDQTVVATLGCMLNVGDKGCGFEMQLEAIYRALHDPIPENEGFLRPGAALAVLVATDEDDCSVDPGSDLFAGSYGALNSFRCTRFGVVCGGPAPIDTPNTRFFGCRPSTAGDGGKLTDLGRYVDYFRQPASRGGVKDDPSRIVVAAFSAPSEPFVTSESQDQHICGPDVTSCPTLMHSCVSPSDATLFGDPAVRFNQVIRSLPRGVLFPMCDLDYAGALGRFADQIDDIIDLHCLADSIPDPANPDCTVEDELDGVRTPLPACGTTAGRPCWRLAPDERCIRRCNSADGQYQRLSVVIDRGAGDAPAATISHLSCVRSVRVADPVAVCGP
jgi:hypothetical protein